METKLKHPVLRLIEQGEGLSLDFKFAVNDSLKIARSLVAFANTEGGVLLIGVKDNGVVAGIRTAEEYYMVEAAAQVYSVPPVIFSSKEWNVKGKKVLEIRVRKSETPPHSVIEAEGKYRVYLRIADSNVMADRLIKSYLRLKYRQKSGYIAFGDQERMILGCLSENGSITVAQLRALLKIQRHVAERILVNLMLMDIVRFDWDGKQFVFMLVPGSAASAFE